MGICCGSLIISALTLLDLFLRRPVNQGAVGRRALAVVEVCLNRDWRAENRLRKWLKSIVSQLDDLVMASAKLLGASRENPQNVKIVRQPLLLHSDAN